MDNKEDFVLYTYMPSYRAWKILITAEFNRIYLAVPEFKLQRDNVTPDFLKTKNPLGKVPVLQTSKGCIFESNAIMRYIARLRADTDLLGASFHEQALVDQWVHFCSNELEPLRAIWLFPVFGFMEYDPEAREHAKDDLSKALAVLEYTLRENKERRQSPFLVGESATVADIAMVACLLDLFTTVIDPAFRAPFPHVTQWLLSCVAMPEFKAVVGPVRLADKEMPHQPLLESLKSPSDQSSLQHAAGTSPSLKAHVDLGITLPPVAEETTKDNEVEVDADADAKTGTSTDVK